MKRREIFRRLQGVYDDLARRQAKLLPVCRNSGDYCRFDRYGHQLWLSSLELEYLKEHPRPPGNTWEGSCPFLNRHRCTVWANRALGCRIFYCDSSYASAISDLDEEFHRKIHDLHDLAGVPYRFFPLGELGPPPSFPT